MRWQKLSRYVHENQSVTITDDLLVSDSKPPYCVLRVGQPQSRRYLAFFGLSNRGTTAKCLGGFSDLASAKKACEAHFSSRGQGGVEAPLKRSAV